MDPKTISPTELSTRNSQRLEAEMRERGLLKEPDPEPADGGYTSENIAVLAGLDQGRRRPR